MLRSGNFLSPVGCRRKLRVRIVAQFLPPGFYFLTSLVNAVTDNWTDTLFVITARAWRVGLAFYVLFVLESSLPPSFWRRNASQRTRRTR